MITDSSLHSTTPAIDIYIKLAQYPVLADRIRLRMREELFQRGVITRESFEFEVKSNAVESQKREGLLDPFKQEEANIWQKRKERIRDYLTDAYFAFNLGSTLLEQIIVEVRSDQPAPTGTAELTFNPEIAPWELLFRQGELYEQLPETEREAVDHHLEEIKGRTDQTPNKRPVTIHWCCKEILQHRRFAAHLPAAHRHRQNRRQSSRPSTSMAHFATIRCGNRRGSGVIAEIPDSYFLGTEMLYEFRLKNGLDYLMNQKYRPLPEIREQYPHIVDAHLQGEFPEKIVDRLRTMLAEFDGIAPNRALIKPAGRQLWLRFRRQVQQLFLPKPGNSRREPGRSPAGDQARLCQHA